MLQRLLAVSAILFVVATYASAQQSPHDLVRDVVYNELHDRERDSYWQYHSTRVTGSRTELREQIETQQGPVYRVIEINGKPLDADQRKKEDARLTELLTNPRELARNKQNHEQDEERLHQVLKILPEAFLFDYEGSATGDTVRIAFHPNPAFAPHSYEERILHGLTGVAMVNQTQKRLIDMSGKLIERIDFGYGILGHVEKDGVFQIHREQVNATHWKTSLVDVHVQGKILLFSTITKDQHEVRSGFRPVPLDISPVQAKEILDHAMPLPAESRLQ